MENNQNTNNFDAMLKQSLEGSQMPVPTGVWEAVGSSIGTKAIVATKIASLKLIILKTVAGVVLAGGVGFGVYELLKPETNNSVANNPVTNSQHSTDGITLDTIFTPETNATDNSIVSKAFVKNEDSMINYHTYENNLNNEQVVPNTETPVQENKATEKSNPVIKTETTQKQSEPEKIKEAVKENKEDKTIVAPSFPEPPNVFTPDGDGLNDDFKIVVENEKIFNLQIYDDRGNKVFETNDKNIGWTGKNMFTGEMCKRGVYIYTYYYELNTGFRKKDRSMLTLL